MEPGLTRSFPWCLWPLAGCIGRAARWLGRRLPGPQSLWVFLILTLWPFKGNVMTSGAIDAGRGCSGRRVGRILEESYKRPQGPEDSEAFLQRLRVHAALARRPCTRDEPPGARGPGELTLPLRGNLAARGPSAQTTAACLLSAAPRHQSGASSHVQAKQLLPITCSSPFSSPW